MAVFNADDSFVNYLLTIGYHQKEVAKTDKRYFVNKKGCQVRVSNNEIALIDKGGYTLRKERSIESSIIELFSNGDH